jgi:acetylornithine deacetylase/succinyl-diaminopimelate desuccinylase-like protein
MSSNGSRAGAIARAVAYFDKGEFEAELARRLAVRSESQALPDSLPECDRYLDEEMKPAFEAMGFACRKYHNPVAGQAPVLLATRIEDDTLPTVLGYGHGDVVRGMDEQWTKGHGPWVTAREGDRLYGRGTADNKGQHTVNMAAIRAMLAERGGRLGLNMKFIIEMGEETGSKGLKELVQAHTGDFAADVFIGSDGPRVQHDRPTLTLGCRGAQNFDLVVDLREGGHHSGNWGGLLANPGFILAHALASIVGPKGELLVEELKAPPISKGVKDALADVQIDGGDSGPAVDEWWGEPGLTPAERVCAANSFNILAFSTGTPGRPVNAIPPKAVAHCQLRFVAGNDAIVPALERHLRSKGHTLVQVTPPPSVNNGVFNATRTEPDHPWVRFVRESVERSARVKPAVIPSMGGSICNDIFTDDLGLPAIWLPHSYASCSQHWPDEHALMPLMRNALHVMTGLYWDIGEGNTPYGQLERSIELARIRKC